MKAVTSERPRSNSGEGVSDNVFSKFLTTCFSHKSGYLTQAFDHKASLSTYKDKWSNHNAWLIRSVNKPNCDDSGGVSMTLITTPQSELNPPMRRGTASSVYNQAQTQCPENEPSLDITIYFASIYTMQEDYVTSWFGRVLRTYTVNKPFTNPANI